MLKIGNFHGLPENQWSKRRDVGINVSITIRAGIKQSPLSGLKKYLTLYIWILGLQGLAVPCTIKYSFTIFSPFQTPNGQTCVADINSGEDK